MEFETIVDTIPGLFRRLLPVCELMSFPGEVSIPRDLKCF